MKYAVPNEILHILAVKLVKEVYEYFQQVCPTNSMSTATCFVRLYEYLKETYECNLLNMEEFKTLLQLQIKDMIEYDTEKWKTDYVCKPSQFITSKKSNFYLMNQEICDFECAFITDTQNDDGTWNINWTWRDYPEEWHISKN